MIRKNAGTIHLPPTAGLVIGILAASSAAIFIRFALREAPALVIAAARLTIASVILLCFVAPRHFKEMGQLSRRQLGLMGLGGVFLALHFATWITSLEYTSVASSAVLVTTTPLWVALLSPIFLKEKISRNIGVGLAVALVGGIIVAASEACKLSPAGLVCENAAELLQGKSMLGNLLAVLGAWFAALYLVIGRSVRSKLSLSVYTTIVYSSAALVLLGLVAITGQSFTGYSAPTYFFFLALAVIPQLIGHSLFNWALKYVSAAVVSVVLLGEPIGSTVMAFAFLGEPPTILEMAGGVLLLFGIYLASRPESVPAAAATAEG